MSHPKRNLIFSLLLALLIALATGSVLAQTRTTETVIIGFIGYANGAQAARDNQLYQAAVLAAEQINAGNDDDIPGIDGPNNRRYELSILYYAADTADEVQDALNDAVNDGAVAVIGLHDRRFTQAVVDGGTPQVAVLSAAPDGRTGTRVYRLAADYDAWARAAADYLTNERRFSRVAAVTVDTSASTQAATTFKRALRSGVLVADLVSPADEDDFLSDARAIRDARVEAVLAWVLPAQMPALLDALEAVGWSGTVIYAGSDASVEIVSGRAEIIRLTGWSAAAYDATSEAFVLDYLARWGGDVPDSSAAYYDAVYLLANALSRAGTTPSSLANQLSSASATGGVQGTYSRAQTDAVMLVQVADDAQTEVGRYASNTCINCLDTWWADTTTSSASSRQTFNIGLIATSSGVATASGQHIEQAARLAIREINDAGGVLRSSTRYTLNLTVYDATTTSEASTAFQQAVSDGMQIIIGPDYNAHILPNLNAASNAGVVQLVSATSPQITVNDANDIVFQLRATDETLAAAAATYLVEVRDLTRLVLVAARTDYGLDSARVFTDTVDASDDGEVVLRLEHEVDLGEYGALAERIVSSGAQAVAVWSPQPIASGLLTELDALGWDGLFMYGYLTPEFTAQITDVGVEVIGPVTWWASVEDWATQSFVSRYSARYASVPNPQSAAYYDAIYLIATALEKSGSTTSNLRSWLNGLSAFNGVQGPYSPNTYDTGELTRAVTLVRADAGAVHAVARYDGTTCRTGCR